MSSFLNIRGRRVGPGEPVYVIAEIGTNHNRDIGRAKALIDASAEAGVDAVKFQLYEASDIVNKKITMADYGLDKEYGQKKAYEAFDEVFRTPRDWFPGLSDYASSKGLHSIATAHSVSGARFIAECGMDALKIASMDCNNLPLILDSAAASALPLLISTGMTTLEEIERLAAALGEAKAQYGLLHCVSNYPPDPAEMHLGNIRFLAERLSVPIGLSDHSIAPTGAVAAVALGACVVEKHITLDRTLPGPDHIFATQPQEFKDLVDSIRACEAMVSKGFTPPSPREMEKRELYRRSVVAARAITAGERLAEGDTQITRPGTGIDPSDLGKVFGRKAVVDIPAETAISWDMLEPEAGA